MLKSVSIISLVFTTAFVLQLGCCEMLWIQKLAFTWSFVASCLKNTVAQYRCLVLTSRLLCVLDVVKINGIWLIRDHRRNIDTQEIVKTYLGTLNPRWSMLRHIQTLEKGQGCKKPLQGKQSPPRGSSTKGKRLLCFSKKSFSLKEK